MRLRSSDAVVSEANDIVHKILDAYTESNRTWGEIRGALANGSIDLFSRFAAACRAELVALEAARA